MPDVPLLATPRSERVKAVAALGRRAVRDRRGLFLVEGPQAVRELLGHAAFAAVALYLTPAAGGRHPELVRAAGEADVPVHPCTPEVLAAMVDTDTPQGMVAVARQVDVAPGPALAGLGRDGYAVLLAQVRDPGNAGTVVRGADAFGAGAVLLSAASVDLYNPKTVRSTVGSLFHLPISLGTPVPELLSTCRDQGVRLLAADVSGDVELPDVDLTGRHAWVLGNEAWGLPPEVLQGCDEVVRIPIRRAESLNLAMAATVCLHTSATSRRRPG